jgi:hypothetical protein
MIVSEEVHIFLFLRDTPNAGIRNQSRAGVSWDDAWWGVVRTIPAGI